MVSVPASVTVRGAGKPEPAAGEALIVTEVVLVVFHCNTVPLPILMVLGLADSEAVGVTFVLMLISRVAYSGPLQPVLIAVIVKVAGLFTVKLLVPPEADTPVTISVELSVMVTVSALEAAQVRLTILAGGIRQ
jgi:hypothetical protein